MNTSTPNNAAASNALEIHTGSACPGNQYAFNHGGWGYVITDSSASKQLQCWGYVGDTTNNQMAVTAAIRALRILQKREPTEIAVYSSSEYLVKGMNEWLPGWIDKGWKKIKNKALWLELQDLSAKHSVSWRHVKGHSGSPLNELADKLASRGAGGASGHTHL